MHLNNGLDIPPRNRDILETSILEILRTYNASMWLAGPGHVAGNYVDSVGALPLTTINEAVGFVEDGTSDEEPENYVANSDLVGLVMPSTFPPDWLTGAVAVGLTREFVNTGVWEDGTPYVDIRLYGTPATSATNIFEPLQSTSYLPIVQNEIMTGSFILQLVDGVLPTAGGIISFGLHERDGGGAISATHTIALPITPGDPPTRFNITKKSTAATTARGTLFFRGSSLSTITYFDFTVRVGGYQINKGNPQPLYRTSGSVASRAHSYVPAYQETTGFKPLLVGGVTNHVCKGMETSDGTQWFISAGLVKESYRTVTDLGEVVTLVNIDTVAQHSIRIYNTTTVFPSDVPVEMSVHIRYISGDPIIGFQFKNNAGGFGSILTFNAMTGVLVFGSSTGISLRIEKAAEGFWRCTFAAASSGAGAGVANLICYFNAGASVMGSTDDKIEIGGGMMLTGALPYNGPFIPSGASGLTYADTVPYSWEFDGVDDRLVVAKPTVDPATDHFKIVCYRNPPVAAGVLVNLGSTASSLNAAAAIARIYTGNGFHHVNAIWRDDAFVSNSTIVNRNNNSEKLVVTVRRNGANVTLGVRGDLAAPGSHSAAITYGTASVNNERIGSHAPSSTDVGFWTGEIYGVISGNGNPSAGELLAMENFLAGCAGFTPLP